MASTVQESKVAVNVETAASQESQSPVPPPQEIKPEVETTLEAISEVSEVSEAKSPVVSSTEVKSPAIPSSISQSPTSTTTPSTKRISVPPPGYKFVKVRAKDGTIKTVKRKLSPEELAAVPLQSPIPSISEAAEPSSTPKTGKSATSKDETTESVAGSTNEISTKIADSPKPVSNLAVESTREIPSAAVEAQQKAVPENSISYDEALTEQNERYRKGRFKKFRRSLGMGLATVVGSAMPSLNIDIPHEGDEVVEHEDDPSDLEQDEFDFNHQNDSHHEDGGHIQIPTGAMASAVAAGMMNKPEEKAPIATVRAIEDPEKEKSTFGLTSKKLEEVESQREAKEKDRPLVRHWATFSFYFLASLAVILPMLFIIHGIFLARMNHKLVSSNWRKLAEANKIAISAWPIIFAAVVAQSFKSYATFQVERGIRLMQLEQLIGSNSFGNAVKQPLMLRRINVLALTLFVVWCLSPLGSQALQRVFTTFAEPVANNTHVSWVDTQEYNQLFSPNVSETALDETHSYRLQIVSEYYNAMFLPMTERDNVSSQINNQDRYDNPMIPLLEKPPTSMYSGIDMNYSGGYGVPFIFPYPSINMESDNIQKQMYEDSLSYYDYFYFTLNASYYKLNCGTWSLKTWDDLDNNTEISWDYTSAMLMFPERNHIQFGSLNRVITTNVTTKNTDLETGVLEYSFIECDYTRVWVSMNYSCSRTSSLGNEDGYIITDPSPECWLQDSDDLNYSNPDYPAVNLNLTSEPGSDLGDFSREFLEGTQLVSQEYMTSGTDNFLNGGRVFDDPSNRTNNLDLPTWFNLSKSITTEEFSWYFGFLLNTWISLAYCPECIDADGHHYLPPGREEFYRTVPAPANYTFYTSYVIDHGWLTGYFLTASLLMAIGIVSISLESRTVAPDTLGYISTAARNSKYLHLPPYTSQMSGPERAQHIGNTIVMMQDVKSNAETGRIVLGNKYEGAVPLKPGRVYR